MSQSTNQKSRLDHSHQEVEAQLMDIEFDRGSQTRANVSFVSHREDGDDLVFEDYRTWRFALTQILKFAGVRKGELKEEDDEGNTFTKENAAEMVLDGLEEETFVFKIKQGTDKYEDCEGEVLGVVSTNYCSISTGELDDMVNQTLGQMGISGDDMTRNVRRRGYVSEIDYSWKSEHEVESVGDTLDGGITIRNSVFGASSLRVGKFYTVLACQNGMVIQGTEKELRQVHMGDAEELREKFRNEVEAQVEEIWEETNLIERAGSIDFPAPKQIEFLRKLGENGRITKTSAGSMIRHIINDHDLDEEELEDEIGDIKVPEAVMGDYNLGRENAWNLVNVMTGYTTHESDVSDSSRKKLQRVYDSILKSEDQDDVLDIVQ